MHGFPIIFPKDKKMKQSQLCRGILGNWYSSFSHSMVTFFSSSFHPLVYFITLKMHGFSYQSLIVWKDAARPTLWGKPGIKISIYFQNKVNFLPSYSYRIVFYIKFKIHKFSHQFLIAWVNAVTSSYGKILVMGTSIPPTIW